MSQTEQVKTCPNFPYFGATYPDACCIDGILWDLDKCEDVDGETVLYSGGDNPPCPFCNTENFIEYNLDEENFTREGMIAHIEKLRERYS